MGSWLTKKFDLVFGVLAIIELIFVVYFPEGRVVTKPLIMITLFGYYFLSSNRKDRLFLTALFFAFLGDTFLLSDDLFLFGLGSFLVMQLLYAICFYKQSGLLNTVKTIGIVLVITSTVVVLMQILPSTGPDLKLPVIVYTSAIALMAVTAIGRNHIPIDQYRLILFGVVAFLISDSLLGINKFGGGFELAGLLVMSTYILAQYLIVKGYLRYEASNKEGS